MFILGIGVAVVVLFVVAALTVGMVQGARESNLVYRKQLEQQNKEQRARIGTLEAAAGLPLYLDGTCRSCHRSLVVGAKYCVYCKTPVAIDPNLCPSCASRNVEDALYCMECGTPLTAVVKISECEPQRGGKAGQLKARPRKPQERLP